MNRAVEDDLPTMTAGLPVGLHWARVRPDPLPSGPQDETYLNRLIARVPSAIERLAPDDLDAIILACTSAAIDSPNLESSVQITTAYECFSSALTGVPTMLCTPYSEELTEALALQLTQDGRRIDVCVQIPVVGEFRDIQPAVIAGVLAKAMQPHIEQIAISCTALYTMPVRTLLSERYGIDVPITSSISAIATYIRRLCNQP
jgi:maleate cis-trans isomerase